MQLARTTGALTDDGLRHPDVTPGVHARVSILRTPCLARWQSAVPRLTCWSTLPAGLVYGFTHPDGVSQQERRTLCIVSAPETMLVRTEVCGRYRHDSTPRYEDKKLQPYE